MRKDISDKTLDEQVNKISRLINTYYNYKEEYKIAVKRLTEDPLRGIDELCEMSITEPELYRFYVRPLFSDKIGIRINGLVDAKGLFYL